MPIYLHDIPLAQAQSRFLEALQAAGLAGLLGVETIPLDENALGRTLAEPLWAAISAPHYHASAMDGFAVRAADTTSAAPHQPLSLRCGGEAEPEARYLDTGDPLPDWADAVIPIENVEPLDAAASPAADPRRPFQIRLRAAVVPWSHVRALGEDMVATQLALPAGQVLRPVDLGAAAACGHTQLTVSRRPRVAILPSGSELTPIGHLPQPGEIIEYNSVVLAAQVQSWGGLARRYPPTPDVFEQLRAAVLAAAQESDLVLLNAGSSAGSEDFSAQVIESLGEALVHGIAVRPGHPVILGMLRLPERQVPVIGVPGYPVSAALTGEILVEPMLARWLGRPPRQLPTVSAQITRKLTSPAGDDDYVRVTLGRVGGRLLAAPLGRGAGAISSLVRADGLALLPRGVQGLEAGAEVEVQLYRPAAEIENAIFCIGSHDILLDLLAQFLAQRNRRLASANAGSLGGLVALRRGEAHLAGSHLLDPASGEYNLAYLQQYLPDLPVKLIALAERQQGLMLRPGNPKAIHSLADLARPEVRFVNRQRGAGTRVLLDYELTKMRLAADEIQGYNAEEYTHLAVAAAVLSGRADCGLGIAAAAQALGLDFIPLFQERYDLVIPQQYAGDALLQPLLELLHEAEFRRQAGQLPGYSTRRMGEVILE